MANEKRLVDANVLIRDLTAMKSVYDAIALDGMIKALNEAPTVDAMEVVHGRWIISGEEYRNQDVTCSACGDKRETYGWPRKQLEREYQKKHYCPNCGAKMDGDGDG